MDLSAFYSIVAGINFTLLGLWWVAGIAGAVGLAMLAQALQERAGDRVLVGVLRYGGVPLYVVIALVAAIPGIPDALNLQLSSIEIEGFLLTLMVFLGVQSAWVVAMTTPEDEGDTVT